MTTIPVNGARMPSVNEIRPSALDIAGLMTLINTDVPETHDSTGILITPHKTMCIYVKGHVDELCSLILRITQMPRSNSKKFHSFVRHVINLSKSTSFHVEATIIYIRRLAANLPSGARGNLETAQRLFLTALLIARKFLDDESVSNTAWYNAFRPWLNLAEILKMEKQFLKCLDYELVIHPCDLQQLDAEYQT